MARKLLALLALASLLVSPAAGFDTYWHSQCSQKVGEQFGFAEDAWKIMQLGDFSPDFFGPVSEYASKNLKGQELAALRVPYQFDLQNGYHSWGLWQTQLYNALLWLQWGK